MTMKIQQVAVLSVIMDAVIFDTTVNSKFTGSYGFVRKGTVFHPISNKSGSWKFLARTANGSCVYSAGSTNTGRYRYQNTIYLTQSELAAIWAKAEAASAKSVTYGASGTGSVKSVAASEIHVDKAQGRILQSDAIVYNKKMEKSQFFRSGTQMTAMVSLLKARGFPEDAETILVYLSNMSSRPLWTTQVVTRTVSIFAL